MNLSKIDDKDNGYTWYKYRETVVAVVIEDRIDSELISLYQLLAEIGNLPEKLVKQFLH